MGVAAAAVGAGISAVGGVVKTIRGAKQERQAREAIENYERQDLTNAFGDVRVSTLGAELKQESLDRATATSVQALQQGGVRALASGVGAVQEANITQSREIAADLDRQQTQIEAMKAQDEVRIQEMIETREQEDLRGLGQQLAVGQQNVMSGIGDIAGAAGAVGRMASGNPFSKKENPFQSTKDFLEANK